MFWSVCACAGPGQLKAAARAGVAGGRCSESVSRVLWCRASGRGNRLLLSAAAAPPPQPRHRCCCCCCGCL